VHQVEDIQVLLELQGVDILVLEPQEEPILELQLQGLLGVDIQVQQVLLGEDIQVQGLQVEPILEEPLEVGIQVELLHLVKQDMEPHHLISLWTNR